MGEMTDLVMDVTIDDPNFSVPALVDPLVRWNGFLCPRFEREAAEKVVDWINNGEYQCAHWDGETLVVTDTESDPAEERFTVDTDGLYPIGAFAWRWDSADDKTWHELHG
jgi:hypothetical protein